MSKPLRSDPKWMKSWMSLCILFVLPFMLSAQDCEGDIMIIGSNYVCENSVESYGLAQTFPGQTGDWRLDPPGAGTLSPTTGNAVDIEWNGGDGNYALIVEFTAYQPGCPDTYSDTLLIEVVSDFGLQLACNDTVQVSLGTDCQATITPDIVLEGTRVMNEDYNVYVKDMNGDTIPGAVLDGSYAGQLLEVSIEHDCSTNSCWGWLRIEDKIGPMLECIDYMVGCSDETDPVFMGVPGFPFDPVGTSITTTGNNEYRVDGIDSCGSVTLAYSDQEQGLNCIGEATTSDFYTADIDGGLLHARDTSDGSIINTIQLTLNGLDVTRVEAMATNPSTNELYAILNNTGGGLSPMFLGKIDITTGVVTEIAPLNTSQRWSSMTFNGLGDKMYVVTGSAGSNPETIFEINQFTGQESFVCSVANGMEGEAIAYNPWLNVMYSISGADDSLRVFDLNTCTATGIDLSGTALHGDGLAPVGLAFDQTRGDLIVTEGGVGISSLYRVTTEGDVQFIGNQATNMNVDKAVAFIRNTPKISEITRTWLATDESGNTATCIQTIQVRPTTLLEVVCPGNYDDIDNTALDCDGGWAVDKNGNPDPSVTGFPTGVECSNIDYDYIDYKLGICESSYKIVREWLIADWCSGEQVYCNQIIKVMDKDGPQVSCPPNDTFSVQPFDCIGEAIAPNPLNYILPGGECSNTVDVQVTVKRGAPDCQAPGNAVGVTDGVFKLANGDYRVTDLPLGCSWIVYTYTDDCGNTSSCSYDVFIQEDKKPVAVCDQHTVVTLSNTGTAKVFASTFDDGSYDNCEVDSFSVRRMTAGNCPSGVADDTLFRNYVEFCCADAGDALMVVFRVYDKSGNFNECMVEVRIVDKIAPVLDCPPNITVSCEYDFADISVFGEVHMDEADRKKIIIDDPNNPNVPRNNEWGIDGLYYDDCMADTSYTEVDNRNDCGIGQIRRTWSISDANTTRSCTQIITFRDFVPFDGSGIRFPTDRTLVSCPTDVDPSRTGEPVLPNTGTCADLLVTYDDQVYNIVPDACYKILRTWTVVDWCNNNLQTNRWTGTQVIKILNTEDPEITSPCTTKVFKTVLDASCTGIAELEVEVSDDCTPNSELILNYKIDLDKDGDIDFEQTGDSSLTATNTYPEGTHEICWTVEDKCGNTKTCCYDFIMEDGKKPTPYCRPGIVTVVMPSSGMIEIWASDFDDNSFDNCTARGDLRFSFSSNTRDNRRTYNCDSLENGIEQTFEITVYVTDEAGNQDFCETRVTIQDGIDDVCPDNFTGTAVTVSGNIVTEDAETVEEVMVTLEGQNSGLPRYKMTDNDGQFAFPSIPANFNYTIGATRDDDHMNGVSTLDLVHIQRHLLGISSFNSAYKHIAADANNSNSVSAADISELRKLILGHYAELPKNSSWRFVLKDFQFADPNSPWPFDEIMEIDDVMNHQAANDFIAVKTGDINGDAKPNGLIGNVVRSEAKLAFTATDLNFVEGEEVNVSIRTEDAELYGLQLAVQFDVHSLILTDIDHTNGLTSDANLGLTKLDEGVIVLSWNANDGNPRILRNGLIELTFEATQDGTLSEAFGLNTKSISPEAYITDMEVVEVELNFLGKDGTVVSSSEDFELFQNQPNPFDMSTKIAFTLPRMEEASIHIFDVTGKTVHLIQGVFSKGLNEITVGKSELSTSGVLYYRLETKDKMATRKMIMIE